jgi:hypothetical protein
MTINQFLFSLDIDNINIVKLCQYVKESNIIHKVKNSTAMYTFNCPMPLSSDCCFVRLVDMPTGQLASKLV